MSVPYQIETMLAQMGKGLSGARVYVGASQITYSCKEEGGESKVLPNGLIDAPISVCFKVNGKRGASWKMIVSLEPSDTYTVRLWKPIRQTALAAAKAMEAGKPEKYGEVLDESSDVYCDVLQEVIERMYDRAIKKHNDGFIPMG